MLISFAFVLCGILIAAVFWFPLSMIHMNIGSAAGLILGAAFILYGVLRRYLSAKLRRICRILAGTFLLAAAVLGGVMAGGAGKKPETEVTLIVLGCRVNGTAPSLMLQDRIRAAEAYLKEHPEAKCICSGGQGADEQISEAACIFRELTAAGISPDRLFVEDRSTSTKENLQFSGEVLEKNGLGCRVAVVTQDFHCYRGICMARDAGLEAAAIPARTAAFLLPTYFLRECAAILWMWIGG